MVRLNQIKSAVFKICRFTLSPFQIINFRDHNSCRCAMWRPCDISPYIDIVLFLHFLDLWDEWVQTSESRILLKLALWGVMDAAFSSISHEQTQSQSLLFSNFVGSLYLQRITFSDYWRQKSCFHIFSLNMDNRATWVWTLLVFSRYVSSFYRPILRFFYMKDKQQWHP